MFKKIVKYNIRIPKMIYYRIRDTRRNRQRRVALIGYLGAFNLGDEMMLETTMSLLKQTGKVKKITVFSCEPRAAQINRYKNCEIIPRSPLTDEAIRYSVNNNDTLFVNGGALLDDRRYNDDRSLAHDIMRLAKAFIRYHKTVIFYGVSCNEKLSNEAAIADFVYAINNSTYFSVRDSFTLNTLNALSGVDRSKIKLVDDIVFASKHLRGATRKRSYDNEVVGISPVLNKETCKYYKNIIKSAIDAGKKVKIISFFDYNNEELNELWNIKKELNWNDVTLDNIVCPSDMFDLIEELKSIDVLISSRYHCSLVASCMGVPMICLNYNECPHYNTKNKYLFSKYGFNGEIIDLTEFADGCNIDDLLARADKSHVNISKLNIKAKSDLMRAVKLGVR